MSRLPRVGPWLLLAALALWVFWLRAPTFGHRFWNLDEGIYATVGRTVLEGGVMYRDAVDQRTPLCHYATAAIFAVAGVNDIWATRAVLAAMIVATAAALYLLGVAWRGPALGAWATAAFAALSTNMLEPGDAFSYTTEWFLALFSAGSAWWFWRAWPRAGFWGSAAAGAGYALSFLSKQPGLLEVGAPVLLLGYLGATGRLTWTQAARVFGGLLTGYGLVLGAVFAYFWARGALADFYYYAWTYNLVYYGADSTFAHWTTSAFALGPKFAGTYPVLLALAAAGLLACVRLIAVDRPTDEQRARQPAAGFLLAWFALSLAGAASSGRILDHYYLQVLPALALAVAWALDGATSWCRAPRPAWLRLAGAGVVLTAGWTLVATPAAARARVSPAFDAGRIPAEYIRDHSRPDDRVMVWGFYPDFYVYADRRPASRFIYTSFQTGVQPARNTDPGVDTAHAAVHGSMEVLMAELRAAPPRFFVDTSLGRQRIFDKYPLHRYPALDRFVHDHYVELEPVRFRPHGFRVLIRRDPAPALRGPANAPAGRLAAPLVQGPTVVEPGPRDYTVSAAHPAGRLSRVELLVDGRCVAAIAIEPAEAVLAVFPVDFSALERGTHRVAARAVSADGEARLGAELAVENEAEPLSAERRARFALTVVSAGPPPVEVRAPYGATAGTESGARVFFAHAPSSFRYAVSGPARLTGRFGFRPGAYAPENAGRTDGAEFTVRWRPRGGQAVVLAQRTLRPVEVASDRGEHVFDVLVPGPGELEFVIHEGRAGSIASDWTYWSDLRLDEVLSANP